MAQRRLSILGSTGSIGCNALRVVRQFPERFAVAALAAKRNVALLAEQIRIFAPEAAAVFDEAAAGELKALLPASCRTRVLHGDSGYAAVGAWESAEVTLSAMVGGAGLRPTLAAIDAGKTIALANKETLVMAGALVTARATQRGVRILPVDSEHSAIFQCLQGQRREDLDRILLTASGGPFLDRPAAEFNRITPAEALRHPNWAMGAKITIDSATLMNKGLEVIEATWLFGVPQERIQVVVHPQSIVHSMVAFRDGVVMAQMGTPDMKPAIAYALSFPERLDLRQPSARFSGRHRAGLPGCRPFQISVPAARRGRLPPGRHSAGRAERGQRGGGGGVSDRADRLHRDRAHRGVCDAGTRGARFPRSGRGG